MTEKCSKRIHKGWSAYTCSKNAKVERDGRLYCGTHDPIKVAERRVKQKAKWDEKWAAQKKASERRAQRDKFREECVYAVEAIAKGHNDPVKLATDIWAEYGEG